MAVLRKYWSYRHSWVTILIFGFALRLVWALALPVQPISDSAAYDQLAWNIASRGSYEWNNGDITAYWPVGTAFIYSILFRLFGHSYGPIAALNVMIGTLSIALTMELARRWFSGRASLAAGALLAFWPSQIEFTTILASELPFNFMLLLALWLTSVAPIRSWPLRGLVTGISLAGASYIRPTALPLVVLVAAALIWSSKVKWQFLAQFVGAAIIAMAVCVAPWTLRNERQLGARVLISTNGPANFWMGNNPNANGAYMPLPDDVAGMDEVARSKLLSDRAKQFVAMQPAHAAWLVVRKIIITHDRETIGVSWNEPALGAKLGNTGVKVAKAISTLYWWLALALAFTAVAILTKREKIRGMFHPTVLAWGYFALIHGVTVGADRYHFPSIPFIAMLAGTILERIAWTLFDWADETSRRPESARAGAGQ